MATLDKRFVPCLVNSDLSFALFALSFVSKPFGILNMYTFVSIYPLALLTLSLAQGKHKALYSRSIDVGDHVIVVNSKHVEFTGKKWQQKYYR